MDTSIYTDAAVALLKRLIASPSVSRDEACAADIMEKELQQYSIAYQRKGNNLWTIDPQYKEGRTTLLLNAHIDTVKAVESWTRDPYAPTIEGDTLYGLGSNDCGGGLVSLLQVYRILKDRPRAYNLIYLASAEEEVSGVNGIRSVLTLLPHIDVAIVGEPTGMQPAIAEKGLMVLDVTAHGRSGHAARNEGENAIYQALDDMLWMRSYQFERNSTLLGPTTMKVTMVNAGTQHNVIPDECRMVVDVRTNEHYTNQEVYDIVCRHVKSDVKARSFHLSSSHIDEKHTLIKRCKAMGMMPFGSPTLSDQALMHWPSFKLGPGDSARSHSANEYIRISEIDNAISTYLELLSDWEG